MNIDTQNVAVGLGILGATAGFVFALGKWANRRETASARIMALENWRAALPAELDKIYARKDVMELRLQNIDNTSRDTNEKVGRLDDKLASLLVALAKRGDVDRRQA